MRRLFFEHLERKALLSATALSAPPELGDESILIAPQAAQSRDAAYWPFASDSPWNISLGSAANYATITSPGFNSNGGINLNVTNWSHPVYIASASDPLRDFYDESALVWPGWRYSQVTKIASIRVPANVSPDQQSDGHLHIVDPEQNIAVEMWRAHIRSDGSWGAQVAVVTDLTGWGTAYDDYHGVRSGGMSALGGLIRRDELVQAEIPHALAIAVNPSAMNWDAPGNDHWVWPASWSDNPGNSPGGYSTSGNLYMGSLLAIPPEVNIEALGLSPQGLAVARAMQDYGAYVTEQASANVVVYVEPAASNILATSRNELSRLTQYLRVVTNNGPNSVGGGGVARREAAPPLGESDPDPVQTFAVSGTIYGYRSPPIANARVWLIDADGQPVQSVLTNAAGTYLFEDVAPGEYTIRVRSIGLPFAEKELTVDDDDELLAFHWHGFRGWW